MPKATFHQRTPNLTARGNHRGQTKRNLLPLARSSFSSVEVFEDCSGGNSRLSYLLRCGGRSFFDQEVRSQMRLGLDVWEKSRPWFFFGFKSRTHFYFLFSLVCVASVTPKGN